MRVLQASTKRPLDLLAVGAGGYVAAASSAFGVRGDVEVWDFSTGKPTATVGLREVGSLAFTPDGKCLLASGEGRILLVDVGRTSIIANLRPAQESHQFASS